MMCISTVTPRVVVIFYESAMKANKKAKAKAIRTADFKGTMFSRGNFCFPPPSADPYLTYRTSRGGFLRHQIRLVVRLRRRKGPELWEAWNENLVSPTVKNGQQLQTAKLFLKPASSACNL